MAIKYGSWLPILALCLVLYARPTHAFGAGNIGSTSKIEGQNWRHGDIEDTLLTLLTARAMGGEKFSKVSTLQRRGIMSVRQGLAHLEYC